MRHWQKRWNRAGWDLMLTWGQSFGFGLFTSGSWIGFRCNGVDLMFGPLTITIQPPMPQWLIDEQKTDKAIA